MYGSSASPTATRPSLFSWIEFCATERQKEDEDDKTLVCDKRDRPITYVSCGDLHLS